MRTSPGLSVLMLITLIVPPMMGANKGNPNPAEGEFLGNRALMVLPATMSGKALDIPCTVHLVSPTGPNRESVYPCEKWVQPPRGEYYVWVEGEGVISPFLSYLQWKREPFTGKGLLVRMPLIPSGTIRATSASTSGAQANAQLRIISLEKSARAFDRRGQSNGPGIMVPAGRVLAGLFRSNGDAIAIAQPVTVMAGETVDVNPRPPVNGTDILVILHGPGGSPADSLVLQYREKPRPPDILYITYERLVAVWYGVNASHATVVLTNQTVRWTRSLTLTTGTVTTVREIHTRPAAASRPDGRHQPATGEFLPPSTRH